ncbi:MAG: hypothetical protein LBC96_03485, partial [Lachnospiraceae bacterium]|nr:hypothetical protein [Lachnospiraceae bacterium]
MYAEAIHLLETGLTTRPLAPSGILHKLCLTYSPPDRLRYGANVAVLRRQPQLRRDYTPPKCRRSQHSAYEYIK